MNVFASIFTLWFIILFFLLVIVVFVFGDVFDVIFILVGAVAAGGGSVVFIILPGDGDTFGGGGGDDDDDDCVLHLNLIFPNDIISFQNNKKLCWLFVFVLIILYNDKYCNKFKKCGNDSNACMTALRKHVLPVLIIPLCYIYTINIYVCYYYHVLYIIYNVI